MTRRRRIYHDHLGRDVQAARGGRDYLDLPEEFAAGVLFHRKASENVPITNDYKGAVIKKAFSGVPAHDHESSEWLVNDLLTGIV